MKNYYLFLLLALLASCGPKTKSEELQIRDLNKARGIIEDKNEHTFNKVEKLYKKDSTEKETKVLYDVLAKIRAQKNSYLNKILKAEEDSIKVLNQQFTAQCFALLTEEEKEDVIKELEGSILYYPDLLDEIEYTQVVNYQLALEAEMLEKELFQVVLQDFLRKHHKLEWNIIYDEHKH